MEPCFRRLGSQRNKTMKHIELLIIVMLLSGAGCVRAQGSAFTYQGHLSDQGAPANGIYDLEFRVFDLASGGNQKGATAATNDLVVTNGLFAVMLDPGANVFDG